VTELGCKLVSRFLRLLERAESVVLRADDVDEGEVRAVFDRAGGHAVPSPGPQVAVLLSPSDAEFVRHFDLL
jgi:hypothetical protein